MLPIERSGGELAPNVRAWVYDARSMLARIAEDIETHGDEAGVLAEIDEVRAVLSDVQEAVGKP